MNDAPPTRKAMEPGARDAFWLGAAAAILLPAFYAHSQPVLIPVAILGSWLQAKLLFAAYANGTYLKRPKAGFVMSNSCGLWLIMGLLCNAGFETLCYGLESSIIDKPLVWIFLNIAFFGAGLLIFSAHVSFAKILNLVARSNE